MDDLISRQAAIEAMSESLKRVFPEHRQIAEKCLNVLPSAQETHEERTETHACDLISRQAAIDALNGIINRFEQILRDIRESKVDDSVCGMCEYDGAFVGQSGDWCNECPGFEKDDCFKLSDECRKRWLESVKLPAAQPEKRTDEHTKTHACDLISRQAAIDALKMDISIIPFAKAREYVRESIETIYNRLEELPPAQPEIIRCKDCKFYSPMNRETKTGICNLIMHQNFGDNWFCAGAERRTDG